jgi:hypothetical protein
LNEVLINSAKVELSDFIMNIQREFSGIDKFTRSSKLRSQTISAFAEAEATISELNNFNILSRGSLINGGRDI